MNPPCVGDETTCGRQFNRTAACYQVPPGFTFGPSWTTAAGVKSVSTAFCPDVATTPAYDAATGKQVDRGTDGKLVLTTVCPACNYVTGVQSWAMNPCPCFKSGDYCNATSGTNGVCHSDGVTPCVTTNCPPPQPVSQTALMRAMIPQKRESVVVPDKKKQEKELKKQVKLAKRAAKKGQRSDMNNANANANASNCNVNECNKNCPLGTGVCGPVGCACVTHRAPSYAMPSHLVSDRY